VAAGLHWDTLSPEGVLTVTRNVNLLVEEIIQTLEKVF
jgi:hypothetical protein